MARDEKAHDHPSLLHRLILPFEGDKVKRFDRNSLRPKIRRAAAVAERHADLIVYLDDFEELAEQIIKSITKTASLGFCHKSHETAPT